MKRWSSTRSTIILKPLHSKRWATYHHPPLLNGTHGTAMKYTKSTEWGDGPGGHVYVTDDFEFSRPRSSDQCSPTHVCQCGKLFCSPRWNWIVDQIKGVTVHRESAVVWTASALARRARRSGIKWVSKSVFYFHKPLFRSVLPFTVCRQGPAESIRSAQTVGRQVH